MAPTRIYLSLRVATAAWIIYLLYNVHTAIAAPLPQADASAAGGSSSSKNTTLIDPFSTPDYLGNVPKSSQCTCASKICSLSN
jgi:hypothetical protein